MSIRRMFNNAVSIVFTFIKFSLMKLFLGSGFHFKPIARFSPNVVTEFERGSHVSIGNRTRIHSGCKLKVRKGATLKLADDVVFTYNCMINCRDSVTIGEGTSMGPNACIYDHDHDFRAGLDELRFKTAPVVIGKNCWIAAGTVILMGTTIGDNCMIGAGCILKGDIPANSVVTQKRETVIRPWEVRR